MEIKENGLPEEMYGCCYEPEFEVTSPTDQVNGETEKTPGKETPDQKIEETSEQKKKKEKKKKWSFRYVFTFIQL